MSDIKRAAIITGGAGGIGVATAKRLIEDGMDVLLVDINRRQLDSAAAALGGGVITCEADVTRPEKVQEAVDLALRSFGRIDVLANVAGGAGPKQVYEIENIELETWDHVMALNVTSCFLFCRAVVPQMRRQSYGRIINLSSSLALGEDGPPTTVAARLPYSTAKAALLGLTRQLAKDLAADGITVNALLPALILGDKGTRIRDRFDGLPPELREAITGRYPIGRPGHVDEVAAAVAFYASEAASFVSGTSLPVAGAAG